MKRVFYSFLIAVTLLFIPTHVFAEDGVHVDKTTINIEQGSTATFNIVATNAAVHVTHSIGDSSIVSVSGVPDWIDSELNTSLSKSIEVKGLKIGETVITFNTTVATYNEVEFPKVLKVVVNVTKPKSSNNNLSSIKIDGKDVEKFDSKTTTYTLKNTDAASISISATSEDDKAKISGIGTHRLSYGLNTFNIVVTAENGSKKTYAIKVTKNDPRSGDNFLKSLTISPGKIVFDPRNIKYNVEVEKNVTEIKVDAEVNNSKAKVTGTGIISLKSDTTEINVVVTAENGSKKTYTINVVKKDEVVLSSNNNLKSLIVDGYDINFDSNKKLYYLDIPSDVEKVNVSAISDDPNAKVLIDNPELKVGENTIIVEVTAENGNVSTYKIIVNRGNTVIDKVETTHSCVYKVISIIELFAILLLIGLIILFKKNRKNNY